MRIVFFGTPAFAVPSLETLLELGETVVAVITQPDRPKGRSRSTLVAPPVKVRALAAGLPVLQPERPTGDDFETTLRRLTPDLGVVVAYGHLLRTSILQIPAGGMINVHASLLPRWRGAAPIQWAIAHGDSTTGITIMEMAKGMDSGPIILSQPTAIGASETGGHLTDRLATLGAAALREVIVRLRQGTVERAPQDDRLATLAPKISHQVARIDWTQGATTIANRIRAFDPVPGAWTLMGETELKLFAARPFGITAPSGTILSTAPLLIGAGAGSLEIGEVQPAGKPRMSAADWVRGRGVAAGTHLT